MTLRVRAPAWSGGPPPCTLAAVRATLLALPALHIPRAHAETSGARSFDIPGNDLAEALDQFSAQSGLQIAYDQTLIVGRRSPGVRGTMSSGEALRVLLAD